MGNSQVIWIGESNTTAVPQIDLFFNYKVNPEDLKNRIHVEVEGKKTDFNLLTISPDNKVSLRLNGLKAEDKDLDAVVTIDKGLKPEKGI